MKLPTPKTDTEVWKDIPGFEGKYQCSTFGRVKSVDHFTKHSKGGKRIVKGRLLKIGAGVGKYLYVSLGKKNTRLVHRLIALTFIANPGKKPCINHINGNKAENCIENLEWVTYSENELHSYRHLGKQPNKTHQGKFGRLANCSKRVGYFLDDRIVTVFDSAGICARILGKEPSSIRKHIRTGGIYRDLDLRYIVEGNKFKPV